MFNTEVSTPSEFPVDDSKRWSTDVCCTIVGAIFALTLFILACVFFSSGAVDRAYFEQSGNLIARSDYDNFKPALLWAAVLALAVGLICLTITQFTPKNSPLIFVVLAITVLFAIAILCLVKPPQYLRDNNAVKIVVLIIVFGLALIIAVMGLLYRNALRLQGIFLDYARRFIVEKASSFVYIPIFLLLTAGTFTLFLFQHVAFSSKSHSNNNYFDFSNPGFLGWLNIIEFLWALQFLRDSFNFCVSGMAVDWYWGKNAAHWYTPMRRLVTKNWGSVVAGSFLNAFLEIPTLIAELFTCHKGTACNRAGEACESNLFCFDYVFNLIRTDVYSYINLSGIPYCNSARECAKVCRANNQFVGNYNPLKHLRFVITVFAVAFCTLFGFIFANIRLNTLCFWHIAFVIVVVYAVLSWFIDICVDAAESIATSFFVEHFQSHDYQFMQRAIPSFRKEIEHKGSKPHHDGAF